jgi:SAM-dependent methyltransferase
VPAWLAQRVGVDGHVLATDIDVSLLPADAPFEVRRHDVAAEPAPGSQFDLVHARLVLVHLPDRGAALRSMVGSLRPGGWLVIEDADPQLQPLACPDEHGPEQRLANHIRRGFRSLLAGRGVDLAYGRTLPRLLREAGLVEVEAEVSFPLTSQVSSRLEAATVEQVRDRLVAAELATTEEIDQHQANLAAGRLDVATAPMVSTWGRRP